MQAINEKHKSREKAERVRLTVEEEVLEICSVD